MKVDSGIAPDQQVGDQRAGAGTQAEADVAVAEGEDGIAVARAEAERLAGLLAAARQRKLLKVRA